MDLVPLLLLIIIVVLGGVIAYFADRLGRVLGKKRLSLFKLRPRHTAELLTVGAGMLIPLLTILILAVASSGIRKWVALGPGGTAQLTENVDRLTKEQQRLGRAIAGQEKLVKDATAQKIELAKDVASLRKQTTDLGKSLAGAVSQRNAVLAEAAGLKRQVVGFSSQVHRLNATLRTKASDLADVTHRYAQVQNKYTSTQAKYSSLQLSYTELNSQIQDQYKKYDNLVVQQGNLEEQVKQLGIQKTDLDQQLAQTKTDLEGAKTSLETTKLNLDAATQRLQLATRQLQEATQELDRSLGNTRFKALIFPVGSELSRISLRPGVSPVEVRSNLQMLIAESSRVAGENGAKPARPGEGNALLRSLPQQNGHEITVQEQTDAIVKSASDQPDQSVLVANAIWNVFDGESVPLEIHAYRNPVVYHTNDLIAEGRIDGSLSENDIVNQVRGLLLNGVRNRAKRDHMIPNGGEGSFGTVSTDLMLAIVKDIKSENRRVRLQFLAKGETRAADALQLAYRIRY